MSAQHVLIVEDSLVYRRLLSRMLTQWGYIVSEAENGVDALAILENQPVSLVISDWEMPEMNGLTLCREVRRRQFGHYVYLISVSYTHLDVYKRQPQRAGQHIFLPHLPFLS